jgi:hypothetical protein
MRTATPGEKAMLAACFILGLVVGVRHGGSFLFGIVYGIGIALPALFVAEILSTVLSKSTAAFVIAALAVFGTYTAATGPVVRSGKGVCIQTDRWGNEKCD